MAITGTLDLHSGPGAWGSGRIAATDTMFIDAEDGKHYIAACAFFDDVTVGQAESKAIIATISEAQWQAHLAGTGRTAGLIGTFTRTRSVFPGPGTPYFIVMGYQLGGAGTSLPSNDEAFIVGVIYKVNSSSAVVVVDAFVYRAETPPGGVPYFGVPYGVIVKDGFLYAVMNSVKELRPTDHIFDFFVRLPLTGTVQNTAGSWTANIQPLSTTKFNSAFFSAYYFATAGSTSYGTNYASILPLADGTFRIFSYLRQYAMDNELPTYDWHAITTSGSEYWDVDLAHRSNTSVLQTDARSLFNQPWDDEGKTYAGAPSGSVIDGYFAPNIQAVTGGYEITFVRRFSDQPNILRVMRFFYDSNSGQITFVDTFEKTIVLPFLGTYEQLFGMFYRIGDADVVFAVSSVQVWYFGEDTSPGLPVPSTPPIVPPPEEEETVTRRLIPANIPGQRWLIRTPHIRRYGQIACDNLRLTLKRGVGTPDTEPTIWVRANRDNKGFGQWVKRGLGVEGDRMMVKQFGSFGCASDWQFEIASTDDCDIELRKLEILPTPLGHR